MPFIDVFHFIQYNDDVCLENKLWKSNFLQLAISCNPVWTSNDTKIKNTSSMTIIEQCRMIDE